MTQGATAREVQQAFADATREPKLWEIVDAMRAVLARIDEADGEVTPEVDAELTALAPTLERKVEAYAGVYRQLEGEASACAAMAEHYTRRKERLMAQREQLRQRLYDGMKSMGLDRVKAPTATASIHDSPVKLVVTDEQAAIAAGWAKTVTILDRQRLKEALEADTCGAECAREKYAHLEQSEHLRIR